MSGSSLRVAARVVTCLVPGYIRDEIELTNPVVFQVMEYEPSGYSRLNSYREGCGAGEVSVGPMIVPCEIVRPVTVSETIS